MIKKRNSKEELPKIGLNRYLSLIGIFIIMLLLVVGLQRWYVSYQDYENKKPLLKDKISEVMPKELDSYLMENDDAILYIQSNEDATSRDIAADLVDLVKKRDIMNRIVYLNVDANDHTFIEEFNKKYIEDKNLNSYPAFILFEDGKVLAYVANTERQALRIGDIEQLLDQYEIEE